jgi:hypothetical protein
MQGASGKSHLIWVLFLDITFIYNLVLGKVLVLARPVAMPYLVFWRGTKLQLGHLQNAFRRALS